MPRSKKVSAVSTGSKKTPNSYIRWSKNPDWTWTIVAKLQEDDTFRRALFSDSITEAKKENRPIQKNKVQLIQLHAELAEHTFAEDPEMKALYHTDKSCFATSVGSWIASLKSDYKTFQNKLGATGAGLEVGEAVEGSEIYNRIAQKFPWYDEFHGWWWEHPSLNPIGITNVVSATSDEHRDALQNLFDSRNSDEGDEDDKEKTGISVADADACIGSPDWGVSFGNEKDGDGFEAEEEMHEENEDESLPGLHASPSLTIGGGCATPFPDLPIPTCFPSLSTSSSTKKHKAPTPDLPTVSPGMAGAKKKHSKKRDALVVFGDMAESDASALKHKTDIHAQIQIEKICAREHEAKEQIAAEEHQHKRQLEAEEHRAKAD
ncbi:hypothetical protein BS47DRAFT_100774 [Hydnum rufescens UP504]|uniref:Uncharacterized protein n=1 Tax=Hydnum rufescens UP504 TaxID=1448309 RepID=A0A9P6AQK2_9AGAM|nr:hypothetical protein BS47DRAFT_100774 [Hydnum rufescens UP504]